MSVDAIVVEGLSKRYGRKARRMRFELPWSRLGEEGGDPDEDGDDVDDDEPAGEPTAEHGWALRDVSFSVPAGSTFGIVGGAGAGKSTLLRILARVTLPTEGRATLRGRVAPTAPMAVTLFRNDWDARRNVASLARFLNVPRRLALSRVDEILAFADLEVHGDKHVRFLSRGMRERFAFSTLVHLEPDVLLTEKVIGVGDATFQERCVERVRALQAERGMTVVLESSAPGYVQRQTDQVVWLDQGRLKDQGPAGTVVPRFVAARG